ncbi:MAG: hypothetical protein IJN67_13310 [Oscillospiraceae bacterium]|nr:hypothetical protein [Oscillospiraceae bacterium]
MELNETIPAGTTEPVVEQVATMPASEPVLVEVVGVDIDRSFMTTEFMDYSVSEGLLLLIFVVVLLQFFISLVRR